MDGVDKVLRLSATAWTAIGSIVSAVSVVVLAVFNGLFLRAAVKSANAASGQARSANEQAKAATEAIGLTSESNRIARESLQQQKRPWVGLDESQSQQQMAIVLGAPAVTAGELTIDKDGRASIQYAIRVRNFGDAPAQSVLVTAALMVTEEIKDIESEQMQLTKPNQDKSIGQLLFPGGGTTIVSGSAFPSARMKSNTYDHLFEVWLVGTIRYWDRFGNHYYTGFRYWMIDPQTGRPFRFGASPNSTVKNPFAPQGAGHFVQ